MPNEIIVQPGDLITAELFRKLLASIDGVNGRIDAMEAVMVPDVVGALLPAAVRDIISAGLAVSKVLDTEGTSVNVNDPAVANRFVLVQMPSPEERVRIGRRAELLITAKRASVVGGPDITAVEAVGGGEPHVGGGLLITGTGFTEKSRVTIGREELEPSLFTVKVPTQITVPTVPPFADQPLPGTSRRVAIEVANEIDKDVFSRDVFPRSFFEPGFIAVRPFVSNIRFREGLSAIHLFGSNLFQRGLDVTVTVGGQSAIVKPTGEELDVTVPTALGKLLRSLDISKRLLPVLLSIDASDLFLVNGLKPTPIVDPRDPQVTERSFEARLRIEREGEFVNDPGKLFLILEQEIAQTVADDRDARVEQRDDGLLLVRARGFELLFDLSMVRDVPIVVTVGDKSDTFLLRVGRAAVAG